MTEAIGKKAVANIALSADGANAALAARQAVRDGAEPDQVNTLFAVAVCLRPADRLLLAEWIDYLGKFYPKTDIIERLVALQTQAERPIKSVLFELQTDLRPAALRELLGNTFDRLKSNSNVRAILAAWTAHYQGSPIDLAELTNNRDGEVETVLSTLLDEIELQRPDRTDDMARLVSLGFDAAVIKSIVTDYGTLGPDLAYLINRGFDSKIAANISERERFGYYKYEVLRTGRLILRDPVDGVELDTIDCFRAFGRTVYTFRGKYLYYLICGGLGMDAVGIVVPEKSVSIVLSKSNASLLTGKNFASIAGLLLLRAARNEKRFLEAYHNPPQPQPRRIILHVEKTENFAHHLWNFYSSLDHIIGLGLSDRVSRILFSGTEFFGPLANIFPEVGEKIERPRKHNITDPCPFSQDELLLAAGSVFMAHTLPNRILAAVANLPASTSPKPIGSPIIWIGMRLGDKSWVDQETEIPRLISKLSQAYPRATFLIDGFSLPVGQSQVVAQWAGFATRMGETADAIASACVGIDVRSLVGNDLADSVRWATQVDCYLAPLGTTQHKVGWFTDAPGLVYASPSFAGRTQQTPGAWAAEISSPPVFIIGEGASPGERRGVGRARERMENVRLHTNELATVMRWQLDQRLDGDKQSELNALGHEFPAGSTR